MADAKIDAAFGQPLTLPTGVHHRLVIRRARFELQVVDCFGDPAAGVLAELVLGGASLGLLTNPEGRCTRPLLGNDPASGELTFPEVAVTTAEVPEPFDGALAFLGEALELSVDGEHVVQLPPRVQRARLVGLLFDTDKTFLLPGALVGIGQLKGFWDRYPHAHVLIVGHTDTVGQPGHNDPLSEERAESVAAFLSDDVDAWLASYQSAGQTSRVWGVPEDKHMLSHLADEAGVPFYDGPIDASTFDGNTIGAVERFQQWSNDFRGTALVVDGALGPKTRRPLIGEYMAEDETTLPSSVEVATHGCGENHPVEPTGDEVEAEENRRVEVFIFEAGIVPPPPPKGSGGACEEYPAWVAQVGVDIDLRETPPQLVAAHWEP